MLRKVKVHSHGLRFHEALSNSPLTILFQCIGNVKAAQLEDSLKAEISNTDGVLEAVPISFRVKNTLASAAGRPDVAACLQATNMLVGWQLPSSISQGADVAQSTQRAVRESESLLQLVTPAFDASDLAAQKPQPQPPQRTMAALIKASLRLAEKHPVAPLAGFFHGQRIRLADLTRWGELDDATVYGELVAQLDAVPQGLVQSISFGDGGISTLLDSQSAPLLACLEARKTETSAAGADPAASPP